MEDQTRHLLDWSQWGRQWIENLRKNKPLNRELERHLHKFDESFTLIGKRALRLQRTEGMDELTTLVAQAHKIQHQFHQFLRLVQQQDDATGDEFNEATNRPALGPANHSPHRHVSAPLQEKPQQHVFEPVRETSPQSQPVFEPVQETPPQSQPVFEPVQETPPQSQPVFELVRETPPQSKPVFEPVRETRSQPNPSREPVPVTRPVPLGRHTLPPLPYAYDALEPYIDAETMRIHHDKLHQKYVDDLNKAEMKLAEARQNNDFELIRHWERELAFNGAGHYLHTLFWSTMSPQGGGEPSGDLAQAIDRYFGSFPAFKAQFTQAAEKVEGPGWAILVWSPRSSHLEILMAEKHQNLSQWDVVPLLPIDVWEHSYFLQYKEKRPDYVNVWWNLVNWPYVEERFEKARKLRWQPY